MRVFWWQGGVHVEPESDAERAALTVLFNAVRGEWEPGESPSEANDPVAGRSNQAVSSGD